MTPRTDPSQQRAFFVPAAVMAGLVSTLLLLFVLLWLPMAHWDWCGTFPVRNISHFDPVQLALGHPGQERTILRHACEASVLLRLSKEPPMKQGAGGQTSYRLSFVPAYSQRPPSVVRLELGASTARIITITPTEEASLSLGEVATPQLQQRKLQPEEATRLLTQLEAPGVWEGGRHPHSSYDHESTYVLERLMEGRHQVRAEWSPQNEPALAPFESAVSALLKASASR